MNLLRQVWKTIRDEYYGAFLSFIGIIVLSFTFLALESTTTSALSTNALGMYLAIVLPAIASLIFIMIMKNNREMKRLLFEKYNVETNTKDTDLGGYTTVDIPEEKKSVFHDILKGFEEYAEIKGYKVSVSVDSSVDEKVSFKITIKEFGVTRSRETVKNDLNEYIKKIQSGEIMDDMPVVIDSFDQSRVLMALRNRIVFLQQNYEVEKNIREFYQGFIKSIPMSSIGHANPVFHISNAGSSEMDKRQYIATNSSNISQGDDQRNHISSGDVVIASSFKKKQEQIDKLGRLIEELLKEPENENNNNAVRVFENIKEEITEEDEPDKGVISKWLDKGKSLLNLADKGTKVVEKAKDVYDSFGVQI